MGIVLSNLAAPEVCPVGLDSSHYVWIKRNWKRITEYVYTCMGTVPRRLNKESVVTTSTAKPEYLTLVALVKECLRLSGLFAVGKECLNHPALHIRVDTHGCIKRARHNESAKCAKRTDIKNHLLGDLLKGAAIVLEYFSITYMIADIFTNAYRGNTPKVPTWAWSQNQLRCSSNQIEGECCEIDYQLLL